MYFISGNMMVYNSGPIFKKIVLGNMINFPRYFGKIKNR